MTPQRALWKELKVDAYGWSLCSLCKFAQWEGDCQESYVTCKHPLGGRYSLDRVIGNAQYGDDCFLFRPKFDIETAADILGLMLDNRTKVWHVAKEKAQLLEGAQP